VEYRLISTDDHFVEPRDLWQSRVPSAMRDEAPRVVREDDGYETWYMGDRRVRPVGYSSLAGTDKSAGFPKTYDDMRPGCYVAAARLADMDADGIDAQVLYPNVAGLGGQGVLHITDPDVLLASVRAYNDGLAEWCAEAPARLIPNCLIPMWDIELVPDEARRAVGLGHRGIVFAGTPDALGYPPIFDEYWDPLWGVAQELDVPIALHIGGNAPTGAAPTMPMPKSIGGLGSVYTIAGNINVMCNILFSGMLTRFPGLNIVSVESGVGWVPYLLETSDHQWDEYRMWEHGFPERPSDLFRSHIYTNLWFEKEGVKQRHYVGIDNIMWECDYPHPTGIWPNTQRYVDDVLGDVADDERQLILWKNAVRLYHLPTSSDA